MTKLREHLNEIVLAASFPINNRWLDSAAASAMLGYSQRNFVERIACKLGFPAPSKRTGGMRWLASDIDAWMRGKDFRDCA